jgi:UDPglucose 6-dehydrogenase
VHSMKIAVIGGGYVGLVSAACFAELGHDITIIEIDPAKVIAINERQPPIFEIGLEDLLKRYIGNRLRASISYDSVESADIIFICVGTPPNADGSANLSYIESASALIGAARMNVPNYCVVVVKSTVPPGTTENIVCPKALKAANKTKGEIGFAMNPEFLREGHAVADFMHPDRIVIGSLDDRAFNYVTEAYHKIDAPVVHTSLSAAEMIKYTSNAFLATKISFSNEIGNICKKLHIDVYEVMRGVGLDSRIGTQFLNAGVGFGGSCFPKDVSSLISLAKTLGEDPNILKAVLEVNKQQPNRLLELLRTRIGNLNGKKITVLGLAFKDNTDDIRDSKAIPVIQELLLGGACVVAYDPMAAEAMRTLFPTVTYCHSAGDALDGADACLVMTEWSEFGKIDKEFERMKTRIIIEGRRILSCNGTEGICW